MKLFNQKRRKREQLEEEQLQGASLVTFMDPKAVQSEQFRTLRTNIEFAQVDRKVKSLLVTSSIPMEGKTTISSNLAYVMGQTNDKKVLLVDADLRKPTVHRTFHLNNELGLTSLLADDTLPFNQIVQKSNELNMYFLPSGPIPPNPSELLSSGSMTKLMLEFAANFDMVIYDAPPVNPVTDAQILATKTDGALLVVRENYALKEDVRNAKQQLDTVQANILGYVMNGATREGNDYGYGYGYGYGYYGQEEDEA